VHCRIKMRSHGTDALSLIVLNGCEHVIEL
jgi:hypothetical protein